MSAVPDQNMTSQTTNKQMPCKKESSKTSLRFSHPLFLWHGLRGQQPQEDSKYITFFSTLYTCWLHAKKEPSKVSDVFTSPGPWTTSGPLSRGCSQQGSCLADLFWGILITWPNYLGIGFLHSEKWLNIQGFTSFIALHTLSPSVAA